MNKMSYMSEKSIKQLNDIEEYKTKVINIINKHFVCGFRQNIFGQVIHDKLNCRKCLVLEDINKL